MKLSGEIQLLEAPSTRFRISNRIADALGIHAESLLYVALITNRVDTPEARKSPRETLVLASPFPTQCWGRLVRASILLEPKAGEYHRLLQKLNELRLYVRHVSAIDSFVLQAESFLNNRTPSLFAPDVGIPPAVVVTLEVPFGRAEDRTNLLHWTLRRLAYEDLLPPAEPDPANAGDTRSTRQRAREALRSALSALSCGIEWVSSMRTVNAIAAHWKRENLAPHCACVPVQKVGLERGHAVTADPEAEALEVDAMTIRDGLWPHQRDKLDRVHEAEVSPNRTFAIGYADSDDRALYWHVLPSKDRAVARFEMAFPSGGMEPFFLGEVFETVSGSMTGGNVLSAELSPRLRAREVRRSDMGGSWATTSITATFPTRTREEIAGLVATFRRLQRVGHGPAGKLQAAAREFRSVAIDSCIEDASEREYQHKLEPRAAMTLREVRLYHEPFNGLRSTALLSGPNPFTPTHTSEIVDTPDTSRSRLASRICDGLCEERPQNVAIVGAYRSGKTSLLRAIVKRLKARGDIQDFWVDGVVAPPVGLALAVASWYSRESELQDVGAALKRLADNLGVPDGEAPRSVEQVPAFLDRLGSAETPLQAQLLLKELLSFVKRLVGDKRCVVLIDEVSEGAGAEGSQGLATWRVMMEEPDFRRFGWLVSAARSLKEAAPYSPLINIFTEYNLLALDANEADALIDRFGVYSDAGAVVTLGARRFLQWVTGRLPYFLQACCFHLYEIMRREALPIVRGRLCSEVLQDRVLKDLSDYLWGQWRPLPDPAKAAVVRALLPWKTKPKALLTDPRFRGGFFEETPPYARKVLERSGLMGDPGQGLVAPMVALWLLESGECP